MIVLLISSYTHRYLHLLWLLFQKDLAYAVTLLLCCDAPKALSIFLHLIISELILIHSLLAIFILISILIVSQTPFLIFFTILALFFLPVFRPIITSSHLFLLFQCFHFFFFQNLVLHFHPLIKMQTILIFLMHSFYLFLQDFLIQLNFTINSLFINRI